MNPPDKKYPWSTPQVAKMLGMNQETTEKWDKPPVIQRDDPPQVANKKPESILYIFKDAIIFILVLTVAGAVYSYYNSSREEQARRNTNDDSAIRREVENNQIAANTALQANHDLTQNSGNVSSPNPQNASVDTSIPGTLEIPTINVTVPLIWTKDTKDFDADLKKGVVHYPGTALPGELGTAYISGHSSGYAWDSNPYKKIFSKLGDVPDYASFNLTLTLTDGTKVKQQYIVAKRDIYKPDDQEQFKNTPEPLVALSTCWPVGTTKDRLVLFGKLVSTQKL